MDAEEEEELPLCEMDETAQRTVEQFIITSPEEYLETDMPTSKR
jgi:hypothetical protein